MTHDFQPDPDVRDYCKCGFHRGHSSHSTDRIIKTASATFQVQGETADIHKLQARIEELESVLRTLSGCLPCPVFVYGAYGENWSSHEPKTDEYEEINLDKILGEL